MFTYCTLLSKQSINTNKLLHALMGWENIISEGLPEA